MPEPLPKYDKPPVVETVLGAQFERLPKFRTALAGCFWKSYLDNSWAKIEETVRLEDNFERFGDERKWGAPSPRFMTSPEAMRTQIIRSDETRTIQVQDSRFIYNWKKGESVPYPSYDATRPEFDKSYAKFKEFVGAFELGTIDENQWEISYVNHLVKGDLWTSPEDWKSIFPWFNFPPGSSQPDFVLAHWALALPDGRGRLHVDLNFGRTSISGPEVVILSLLARGSVSSKSGFSLEDGFAIGHDMIVRSFTAMTSERAQTHWGRTV
jgi:uncharacterized protein (TIGR04255 family)